MTIAKLPADLLNCCFSYLEYGEFFSSSKVNRAWKEILNKRCQEITIGQFKFKCLSIQNYTQFLYRISPQILYSNKEIINRIKDFVCKIPLGINGRFRCSLGHTNRLISVEIKGSRDPIPLLPIPPEYATVYENSVSHYDYSEYCIAVNGIGDGSCRRGAKYIAQNHYVIRLHSALEYTFIFRAKTNDCIQAVLRFPSIFQRDTELASRIRNIVLRKCDLLSMGLAKQEFPMIPSALEFSIYAPELMRG